MVGLLVDAPCRGGGRGALRVSGQGDKGADAALQLGVGDFECGAAGGKQFDVGRIGNAPVGRGRVAGPERAGFAGGAGADGEDEVEAGAPGAANSSQDLLRASGRAMPCWARVSRATG